MRTRNGEPLVVPYRECTLEHPCQSHFCQIHKDEGSLTDAAIRFLQFGVVNGENLLLITRRSRQAVILDWLSAAGADTARMKKEQKLFLLSSHELVQSLFSNGMPEWQDYENLAREVLDTATWGGKKRVRIYGDAVSELWSSGNHEGAVVLEDFWSRLQQGQDYKTSIFCGYMIDVFSPSSYSLHMLQLGRTHSFVRPTMESALLAGAIDQSVRELLGMTLRAMARTDGRDPPWWSRLPEAFRAMVWLQENQPEDMERVLSRAKAIYAA